MLLSSALVLILCTVFPLLLGDITPKCKTGQWRCNNGQCIRKSLKCNGVLDCADGSDETHAVCWNNECVDDQFQCVYGGCVDGNATCNGVRDCLDNSDEMLLKCRNESDYIECIRQQAIRDSELVDERNPNTRASIMSINGIISILHNMTLGNKMCEIAEKTCKDGQVLKSIHKKCDGEVDCDDGSDETLDMCASRRHVCEGNVFRCAYGGCVPKESMCNGFNDCADGSDETNELCRKTSGKCIAPSYPNNGYYISDQPLQPNATYASIHLKYFCHPGFKLVGNIAPYCLEGSWSAELPICIALCLLPKHQSVQYLCLPSKEECEIAVPDGTKVLPKCRTPNYYSPTVLTYMHCDDGVWDYVATCSPQCGLVTPEYEMLIANGSNVQRGEIPWHVGIYRKTKHPYEQVCGGSLVSTTIVITAAHCFWDDVVKQLPAANFAVAAGKLYRPWNNNHDVDAQKSDIAEIIIPPRFQGTANNFQEDISIVRVQKPFQYTTFIRPVCVEFEDLERFQLTVGQSGKIAGWGLTSAEGNTSQVLKTTDLPYVNFETCYKESPNSFREFITNDKFCAGGRDGKAACKGDSGGGLAFKTNDRGIDRYYLRGIASTAPVSNGCNVDNYIAFTKISKHESLIRQYL